ncbi:hypothetical protein EJ06DRAFT_557217 [Trichodelitschia bisporula]|uniref:Uncharacterized protein n=1 Tax=Trichodelitschia bisporula TaxID=703511 RepID=A0A6G1HTW6_9PEZI|nr:hypothetical protein EJ06DRAFT_557217 [Trichodelitschia bisporula]
MFRFGLLRWRFPKAIIVLTVLELPLTVAALALFGIADPDTYRTKLWRDGALHGWNSDPSTPLYAAANYQPVKIPLVWSSFVTKFNLTISVLSVFLWLVKCVTVPLRVFYPALSVLVNGVLCAVYAFSLRAQTAPDTIDPAHQNTGPPWYITRSCSLASPDNVGYCKQAKAAFYVTVFMVALFATNILFAIHSMLFAPARRLDDDEESVHGKAAQAGYGELTSPQQWEMLRVPPTPGTAGGMKSPITPRTRAFNALAGDASGQPAWNGRG